MSEERLILWLKDIAKGDVALVGGKGANLGEMTNAGFPVPPAFAVSAYTYKKFVEETGIQSKIFEMLKGLNVDDNAQLQETTKGIRDLVRNTPMPDYIKKAIVEAYSKLKTGTDRYQNLSEKAMKLISVGRDVPFVAVRSSATAEDLPGASFAGQQKTLLFIKGDNELIKAVQDCWASLFTARATFYREKNDFDHEKVLISIIVQKQIDSESAGVAFSIHPATGNTEEIIIEAGWGLGDSVVGGEVNPDHYVIDKNTLAVKEKKVNEQTWMYTRNPEGDGIGTIKKNLSENKAKSQVLSDEMILRLAKEVKKIESHYGSPQDIEWAVEQGHLYIVQSRPVTFFGKNKGEGTAAPKGEPIIKGLGASPGVASGKVTIIHSAEELDKVKEGDILVTEMTDPDMVPAMRRAAAIVTNDGGMTCHAAIVSRELGIPCIVGTLKATEVIRDGQIVTVDATNSVVYDGALEIEQKKEEPISFEGGEYPVTGTKIYMNLGVPDKAKDYAGLACDGIGLMRLEFIIASYIGEHPNAMLKQGRGQDYTNKLAEGIAEVARAMNPRPVVVRLSDFKTNEYRSLKGGEEYEPQEENPMIGWRGCSRYWSPNFIEAFKLECRAIKKVRDEMQLKNVWVMLPFVRNVEEVHKIMDILKGEGLERNEDFKIWLMAEVPSIVLMADEFAKICDGFSIGSNDLTQLVLGVDRDSALLGRMGYFNERDDAVKRAIAHLIEQAHEGGITISICGQAPSVYPEFCEFLVELGIDSISVNPDVVNKTRLLVASIERKILLRKSRDGECTCDCEHHHPEQ